MLTSWQTWSWSRWSETLAERSWRALFSLNILWIWHKSLLNEIWSDLDEHGGLGRHKAPNFQNQGQNQILAWSTHIWAHSAHQIHFSEQNCLRFLLQCISIVDVRNQVRRNSQFGWFFKGEITRPLSIFPPPYFQRELFPSILFSKRTLNQQKILHLALWVILCENLHAKWYTPWPLNMGLLIRPFWALQLHVRVSVSAGLEKSKKGGPSGYMLKTPNFGPQQPPSRLRCPLL